MKKLLILPLTVLAFPFSSCAPAPPLMRDNGQVNIQRPSSSLMQQGFKAFETMKRKKKISHNAAYNAQTQRVAARLKRVVDMPGARWEFVVFDDPTPNAFALPGGKVGIHSGLFKITKTDAGLATVIGHEIAHVVRNHAGDRQRSTMGLAILGLGIDQIARSRGASNSSRAQIGALYGAGASVGVALPYSRKHELEADKLGVIYMARAGYNPNEAVKMWERFQAYNKSKSRGSRPEFLSTHPVDTTRINALKAFMPIAMREYNRR